MDTTIDHAEVRRGARARPLAIIGFEFAQWVPCADGTGRMPGVLDFIPVTPTSGQRRYLQVAQSGQKHDLKN
jgi:hypothetical protein